MQWLWVCAALAVFLVWLWIKRRFAFHPSLLSIPRPNGSTWWTDLKDTFDQQLLYHMVRYARDTGDLARIRFIGQPIVLVNSPEYAHTVINDNKQFEKPAQPFFKFYFGRGLAFTRGEIWKQHRTLLQPTFNSKNITTMQQAMVDCAGRYVAALKERIRTEGDQDGWLEINLNAEMKHLTLSVLTETIFGFEAGKELDSAMTVIGRDFGLGMLTWALPVIGKLLPNPNLDRLMQARAQVHDLVDDVIRRRKYNKDTVHTKSILDVFIEQQDAFTSDDIKGHILTLLFAGHDTTAYSIIWAAYYLGLPENAHVKATFMQEVDSDRQPDPSTQLVNQFPYILQVIKESLRLRPPAVLTIREATRDVQLGQTTIPKGTELWINLPALHMSRQLWKDPEAFRPEHFSAEEVEARKAKISHAPFGGGARRCIGENMSLNEQVILLLAIYRNFNLELLNAADVQPKVSLTLLPTPDLRVRIACRAH